MYCSASKFTALRILLSSFTGKLNVRENVRLVGMPSATRLLLICPTTFFFNNVLIFYTKYSVLSAEFPSLF